MFNFAFRIANSAARLRRIYLILSLGNFMTDASSPSGDFCVCAHVTA